MKGELKSPSSIHRWHGPQRRIGLTGGIACGKTTISRFLHETKNIPLLDADLFAREALKYGSESSQKVIEHFGSVVIDRTSKDVHTINRATLRKIIFSDIKHRLWLESLLHPIIKNRLQEELTRHEDSPTIILIIPLLFEANLTELCSEVWVVHCQKQQQIKRLVTRDNITREQAKVEIKTQWPLREKEKLADVVLDNSGGQEIWINQIESIL